MRAVVQLVKSASVSVSQKLVSEIGPGLLVLLGIKDDDAHPLSGSPPFVRAQDRLRSGQARSSGGYIIKKIINLRIFPDENGNMNKSVQDVGGEILLVSQFTLYGDCRKGNRPSFICAMPPEKAKNFYKNFADCLKSEYPKVKEGIFGAYMQVALVNDGPVTILIDSEK